MSTFKKKGKNEWNSYLTDGNQYKLSKEEILEKKKLLVSKNNTFLSPKLLSPETASHHSVKKQSYSTLDRNKNSPSSKHSPRYKHRIPTGQRLTSQSPFTISSTATTRSDNSDDGHSCIDNSDESADDEGDIFENLHEDGRNKKDLSSLDLVEQSRKAPIKFASQNKNASNKTILKQRKADIENTQFSLTPQTPSQNYNQENEKVDSNYLKEMLQEIQTLRTELRYYEELSGRRSILNGEELDAVWNVSKDESMVSQKAVLKYLVELVCQTMTYLLKSEVDLQEQKSKYEVLSTRLDSLTAFVSSLSLDSAIYSNKTNHSPPSPSICTTAEKDSHFIPSNSPESHFDWQKYDQGISSQLSVAPHSSEPQHKPTPNKELIPIRLFQSPAPSLAAQDSSLSLQAANQKTFSSPAASSGEVEVSKLESQFEHYLSLSDRVIPPVPSPSPSLQQKPIPLSSSSSSSSSGDSTGGRFPLHLKPSVPTSTRFTPASASAVATPPSHQQSSAASSSSSSQTAPPAAGSFLLHNPSRSSPAGSFSLSGTSTSDWLFSPPPPPLPPSAADSSLASRSSPRPGAITASHSAPQSAQSSGRSTGDSTPPSSSAFLSPSAAPLSEYTARFDYAPTDVRKNLFPEAADGPGKNPVNDLYHSIFPDGKLSFTAAGEQPSFIAPNRLTSLPTPESAPRHPFSLHPSKPGSSSTSAAAATAVASQLSSPASVSVMQTLLSPQWREAGRVFDARLGSF